MMTSLIDSRPQSYTQLKIEVEHVYLQYAFQFLGGHGIQMTYR